MNMLGVKVTYISASHKSFCVQHHDVRFIKFFLSPNCYLLVQMEEEEEERLRQPQVIQELDPEEERGRKRERDHHGRSLRGHCGCRLEPDRGEVRLWAGHQDAQLAEEGEEEDEEYGIDGENIEAKPRLKPTMRPISVVPSVSSASGNTPNTPGNESPCGIIIPHENSPPDALPQDENRPRIGLSLKLGESMSCTKWFY